MTEPRRLLADPEASTFERNLLESWSSEGPSPNARTRVLTLVAGAVAGAVAATATATGGASSAVGAVGAAVAPKVVAAAGLSGAAKVGILGVMLLVSAIVSVRVVRGSHDAAPPQTPVAATEPVQVVAPAPPPALVPAPAPTMNPPSVSPADLPAAPSVALSATSPSASTRARGAGPADPSSSVTEEIAAFDRARTALEGGEIDRAIGLLDTYERRFPTGTFVQEAEVLRVKALAAKGDLAGARRMGERFLAAHPTSPHASRIRAILDSSSP